MTGKEKMADRVTKNVKVELLKLSKEVVCKMEILQKYKNHDPENKSRDVPNVFLGRRSGLDLLMIPKVKSDFDQLEKIKKNLPCLIGP